MTREYVVLRAEPGENVQTTAQRALTVSNLTGLVVQMEHNGRTVRVKHPMTVEGVVKEWDRIGREVQRQYAEGGVWLAYYSDWSGFVAFANETQCLRHAVTNNMRAGWWPFGTDRNEVQDVKS